jgi:alpha-galactosidase
MPKIAFIGAGSVEFTRNLLGDILSYPDLAECEIALCDINSERLDTAAQIAGRVADALGAHPSVRATPDRREALDGADYVINSVQVGGHAATVRDQEIPARYGLRQTIADTLGIGGIIRALRTAPVMLGIGNDMAELCPGAWLLNYTNPMAMMCQVTYQGTPQKNIVGLCHSVQGTMELIAGLCGVPVEEVTYFGAGINHQTFLYRLEHDGRSIYPLLDRAIEANPDLLRRVRVDMYRRLGYFPTESSEHSAEYSPWYMRHDSEIARLRIPVADYIGRSAAGVDEYEAVKARLAAGEPFEVERSWEYASVIINSMETGEPSVIYGNVRNSGLITNLPDGICVEVPCLVDRTGVNPTHVGDVAPQCAALNRTFANVCDLTVRAVIEGRRDHVTHAAMMDPNLAASLTLDQIDALVAEMLDAYRDLLPESLR